MPKVVMYEAYLFVRIIIDWSFVIVSLVHKIIPSWQCACFSNGQLLNTSIVLLVFGITYQYAEFSF